MTSLPVLNTLASRFAPWNCVDTSFMHMQVEDGAKWLHPGTGWPASGAGGLGGASGLGGIGRLGRLAEWLASSLVWLNFECLSAFGTCIQIFQHNSWKYVSSKG